MPFAPVPVDHFPGSSSTLSLDTLSLPNIPTPLLHVPILSIPVCLYSFSLCHALGFIPFKQTFLKPFTHCCHSNCWYRHSEQLKYSWTFRDTTAVQSMAKGDPHKDGTRTLCEGDLWSGTCSKQQGGRWVDWVWEGGFGSSGGHQILTRSHSAGQCRLVPANVLMQSKQTPLWCGSLFPGKETNVPLSKGVLWTFLEVTKTSSPPPLTPLCNWVVTCLQSRV